MAAQCVMTGTVREAGLTVEQFLSADGGFPPLGSSAVSIATDDIVLFELGSSVTVNSGERAPEFKALDEVWSRHHIVPKIGQGR